MNDNKNMRIIQTFWSGGTTLWSVATAGTMPSTT